MLKAYQEFREVFGGAPYLGAFLAMCILFIIGVVGALVVVMVWRAPIVLFPAAVVALVFFRVARWLKGGGHA